jgi:alpha-L-fucosidase
MVAKHVGGFCMWQTETSTYGIRGTPWKGGRGDVMADLAASCRRTGLGLGVYLSPRDDTFGAGDRGKCATPEKQAAYNALYRRQLTELLTRYGDLVEVWFDGSILVPVGDILAAHAPHAAIFQGPHATIRWVGNEDGFAPYPAWNSLPRRAAATGEATAKDSDPDGDAWLPNEVDVSIRRPNWFWSTTDERNLLSLDALLEIYYRSVGRGAQLLLNIPPDRTGHIAAADAARAKEFGDAMRRRFGTSLGETHGQGREVVLRLGAPAAVDHVVIEEDLRGGERVREYRLEGRVAGGWVPLGDGTAIGHKRIQPVPPSTVEAIRLEVTRAAAAPRIRRLAAFATGAAPPPSWNDPGPR